jgi:hypothetical protein
MTLTSEKLNHVASPSRAGPSGKRTALVLAMVVPGMLYASARTQNFGEWSQAVSVDPGRLNSVNTSVNDGCPIEAPDGHTLFFASNRGEIQIVGKGKLPDARESNESESTLFRQIPDESQGISRIGWKIARNVTRKNREVQLLRQRVDRLAR